MHRWRNSAQHDAECPSDRTLNDSRTYTKDSLEKCFSDVWGLQIESLGAAELITHKDLQWLIKKAEDSLKKKDFTDSACHSVAAFGRLIGLLRTPLVGRQQSVFLNHGFSLSDEDAMLNSNLKNLRDDSERLKEAHLFFALGLNRAELNRYNDTAGGIVANWLGGEKYSFMLTRSKPEKDAAVYALDFVTETIMNVEALVGDIESPFGIDTRFVGESVGAPRLSERP